MWYIRNTAQSVFDFMIKFNNLSTITFSFFETIIKLIETICTLNKKPRNS